MFVATRRGHTGYRITLRLDFLSGFLCGLRFFNGLLLSRFSLLNRLHLLSRLLFRLFLRLDFFGLDLSRLSLLNRLCFFNGLLFSRLDFVTISKLDLYSLLRSSEKFMSD